MLFVLLCHRVPLTDADIKAAQEDMHSILSSLTLRANNFSSWTPPDVFVACYQFNFMIEVAWTLLYHAAIGQRPDVFSKEAGTPWSFKTPPVRPSISKKYSMPIEFKALPDPVRKKFNEVMKDWSPYKDGDVIIYNKVSFWPQFATYWGAEQTWVDPVYP